MTLQEAINSKMFFVRKTRWRKDVFMKIIPGEIKFPLWRLNGERRLGTLFAKGFFYDKDVWEPATLTQMILIADRGL